MFSRSLALNFDADVFVAIIELFSVDYLFCYLYLFRLLLFVPERISSLALMVYPASRQFLRISPSMHQVMLILILNNICSFHPCP